LNLSLSLGLLLAVVSLLIAVFLPVGSRQPEPEKPEDGGWAQPADEVDRAGITAFREVTSLQPARQHSFPVRPQERPWGSGGNGPMRRAVLIGGGVLIGLVAEALLWASPDVYAKEPTGIVGLALLGWGVTAAAGAAFCLARGLAPSRPAPAADRGGPVLPIGGILFVLGAVSPFLRAYACLDALPDVAPGLGPDLLADYCGRGQAALTFGILYLVVAGGLLVAPLFLKPRDLGQRINGAGCGIVLAGLLLSGVGAFVWFANAMAMEGGRHSIEVLGQLGLFAGSVLAVVGGVVAVLGGSSASREEPRDAGQDLPADRAGVSDRP
jgi:hypothetical protein